MIPSSFKLGDSNLNAKANKRRYIGDADLHIVAKVTVMKTSDSLLRFMSSAVARAVGTTVTGKVHLWISNPSMISVHQSGTYPTKTM